MPQSISNSLTFFDSYKKLSGIAFPTALSFTFSFAVFASGLLIGQYNDDEDHMAAITITSTFMNTFMTLGMVPLFGIPVVANNWVGDLRAYKEKSAEIQNKNELEIKRTRISAVNRSGLTIAAMTTVPTFLVLFFAQGVATNVFRQDEKVASIAQEYLSIYAFAVPAVFARMTFEQIIFALGKSRDAMYCGLTSFTIGTLISVWFGFGGFGINAMGLKGIASGFVVESYLIALMYGVYLQRKSECREFNFFNLFNVDKEIIKGVTFQILNWSIPIFFTMSTELFMDFMVGMIAGIISLQAQAALSSVMQFIFFTFILSAAFGLACQQEVGREIGAECYQKTSQLARYGLVTTLTYITPLCVLVSIWPTFLQNILNSRDDNIVGTTSILMPIMAVGIVFDAARYTMLRTLRSLADSWVPAAISFVGLAMGLSLSAALGLSTELGIYGVGVGYSVGLTFATIGLFYRWKEKTEINHVKTVNEQIENPPTFVASMKSLLFRQPSMRENVDCSESLPLLVKKG